jgi:hypothetical protein
MADRHFGKAQLLYGHPVSAILQWRSLRFREKSQASVQKCLNTVRDLCSELETGCFKATKAFVLWIEYTPARSSAGNARFRPVVYIAVQEEAGIDGLDRWWKRRRGANLNLEHRGLVSALESASQGSVAGMDATMCRRLHRRVLGHVEQTNRDSAAVFRVGGLLKTATFNKLSRA